MLFGRDEARKPHAAAFLASEAEGAKPAGTVMALKSAALDSEALRAIGAKLPAGRLFPSGKAFVPFVKRELYGELVRTLGMADDIPPDEEDEAEHSELAPTLYDFSAYRIPPGWGEIKLGSLMLATVAPQEGWWEAYVTEEEEKGLFVMKWRDWPDDPLFLRRTHQLALLPPPPRAAK